jgi:hypothetical protein
MLGLNFRDHAHRQTRSGSPMRKSPPVSAMRLPLVCYVHVAESGER